jgi:ribonuclease HI
MIEAIVIRAGHGDVSEGEDRAQVVRRELLLLEPEVRADQRRVRHLLHPDFTEFGASGHIWEIDEMVQALAADSAPARYRAVDLVPVSLSAGAVLLTYRIEGPQGPSLRSSVWLRNEDGQWLLRFHQGTTVT